MPAVQAHTTSQWKRTRYLATMVCTMGLVGGLLTLAAGHPLYGWLLILAGLMLVKSTVFGKRGRRHLHEAEEALQQSSNAQRKWRKAA